MVSGAIRHSHVWLHAAGIPESEECSNYLWSNERNEYAWEIFITLVAIVAACKLIDITLHGCDQVSSVSAAL